MVGNVVSNSPLHVFVIFAIWQFDKQTKFATVPHASTNVSWDDGVLPLQSCKGKFIMAVYCSAKLIHQKINRLSLAS